MNEANQVMRSLIARRSPSDRLRMSANMFTTARALAQAGITAHHPNIDKPAMRREIFLRFYGNEFAPTQREAIVAELLEGGSEG